jgi:hypothetical protein
VSRSGRKREPVTKFDRNSEPAKPNKPVPRSSDNLAPVSQRQESCWICVRGYRHQTRRVRSRAVYRSASLHRGRNDPRSSRKEKSPELRRLRAFRSSCEKGYSAAPSTALVCATVQSAAPTLKRAKRRTVRFSPSLPTFCAISSLMLMAWSLMNGCSRRQTSS